MLWDVAALAGLLATAYLVYRFQSYWVGSEYRAATFLKLNGVRTTVVFSLAFLGSVSVFTGTVFTGLERSFLSQVFFNLAMLFFLAFFLSLDYVAGGDKLWERG
jgi:hypothetical protein